jgi:Lysozyme like domain
MSIIPQSVIAGYAAAAGLKGNAITIASSIAMAESGGDTNIINPGTALVPEYSVGLWQINLRAHPQYTVASMQNPTQNAAAMFSISGGGKNWNPWSTYTNGSYMQFMGNQNVNTLTKSSSSGNSSTSFQTTASKTNPDTTTPSGSGYVYVLAYTVAIAFFVLLTKSKVGYRAVYYGLLLCILFLFVTQSQFISTSLAPLTNPTPTG